MSRTAAKLRNGQYRLTTHMSFAEYHAPLRERANFTTGGSLRGIAFGPGATPVPELSYGCEPYLGRLASEHHASASKADYVVYSYQTPIAWHVPADDGGYWVQPADRYSPTTSRQQSKIGAAISTL